MKIVSQSADALVLQEGAATGIALGVIFVVAGLAAGVFLHATSPVAIWIALALVVAGLAIVGFSSSITVSANKPAGTLSYRKKRLIGGQDSTYAIADVLRIETRKQWQIQNSPPAGDQNVSVPQPVLVWQSVIVFKDGRELPLDHQKTSSQTTVGSVVLMGGQGAEVAIANHVAEFLDVPFLEIEPPDFGMGIGGIQI